MQGDAGGDFQHICRDRPKPVVPDEFRCQSYIFSTCVEVWFYGMRACPEGTLRVELQKAQHASTVVVVSMGKYGNIHGSEVNPHADCILGKGGGGPGIEENAEPAAFNEQTETMLRFQAWPGSGVFDEAVHLHVYLKITSLRKL